MTVSHNPELRSLLDSTELFSSTAPRVRRGVARGTTPRPAWEPDQVHGAPRLQDNQQHGRVRGPALWVEYSLVAGGPAAPREKRLLAHCQASQGRLLLQ
jgi:hypothetical protein